METSAPSYLRCMLRSALLALPFLLVPELLHAQATLSGMVVDESSAPVPYADLRLIAGADASVRTGITDARGGFRFEGLRAGDYRLQVARIGFRPHVLDLTLAEADRRHLPPLVLGQEVQEMEGISVEARRSLYEHRGDRLLVNVANSPALAGTSALQVLERSPGVIVDRASNSISMVGKQGVRVMVNGKQSYVPADALLQYLSGMAADNIEKIELITSPPANLDAEGNAGYINIVLKRNPDDGVQGSVNLSGGYGQGEMGKGSGYVDVRRGALGVFVNYSFLWEAQAQYWNNFRTVRRDGVVTETPTLTERDPVQRNHDLRAGLEYEIADGTVLGGLVGAFDNRWSMTARNRLRMITDGHPVSAVDLANDEVNLWRHAMANLNLRRELGSGTLRFDLDYLRYSNDNPTTYDNEHTDLATGTMVHERMVSGKDTPLSILVGSADLTRSVGKWELGTGVKGAFSRLTNTTQFHGPVDDWFSDAGFASRSTLRENALALYATANVTPAQGTSAKFGLRYEHTDSNLGSLEERNIVDRRYGSFFPSAVLSHDLNENHRLSASYTRRITRPSFRDIAPFIYFLDPYTFFSGNAGLQPAIVNTARVDLSRGSVLGALQYAWEDSSIVRFQSRLLPGRNIQVMYPANFSRTNTASAVLTVPVRLADPWSTQNTAMLVRQEVRALRSEIPVTMRTTSFRFNSSQSFDLPGKLTAEASGFYQSGSRWGAVEWDPVWSVDLGVKRSMRGGSTVTVTLGDVFDSLQYFGTTGAPGETLHLRQEFDFSHRAIRISYSTVFGGEARQASRTTASEEERARAQ
jgi:hypothetical protein